MSNCMFHSPDQMFNLPSVLSFSAQMQYVVKQEFCNSNIAGSEKGDSQILDNHGILNVLSVTVPLC